MLDEVELEIYTYNHVFNSYGMHSNIRNLTKTNSIIIVTIVNIIVYT